MTLAPFTAIAFLLGTWSGGGVSEAGPGSGTDTFSLESAGNVLVRHSHASYAGTASRPASTYDSMMFFYRDPAHAQLRADYVDEGHAIHYELVPSPDAHVARFLSDVVPGAPRFRLTYTDAADDKTMQVLFEMQPPGAPDFGVTIARGVLTRVSKSPPI